MKVDERDSQTLKTMLLYQHSLFTYDDVWVNVTVDFHQLWGDEAGEEEMECSIYLFT